LVLTSVHQNRFKTRDKSVDIIGEVKASHSVKKKIMTKTTNWFLLNYKAYENFQKSIRYNI